MRRRLMDLKEQACWLLLTFKCGLPIRAVNQIVKSWCQQNKRTLQEFFTAGPQEWSAICQLDDKVMKKLERVCIGDASDNSEHVHVASMLVEQTTVVEQLVSDAIHIMTVMDEKYPGAL